MTPREAAHYKVLRLIEEQPEISQRELSRALGVSLGKTHYLLKALLDKGLVKADIGRCRAEARPTMGVRRRSGYDGCSP